MDTILNRRGTTWRKLADAEQRASNAAARIRALGQERKTAKALVADASVRPDPPAPARSLALLPCCR